jgi:hypothetical protein
MKVTWIIGMAVATVLGHGTADAAVITFDEYAGSCAAVATLESGGFTFTSTFENGCDATPAHANTAIGSNGTPLLISAFEFPILMTLTAGGTFSFQSFDGEELWDTATDFAPNNPSQLQVIGQLAGGGTATATFNLDGVNDGYGGVNDLQHFLLPSSFSNLTSVLFTGFRSDGLLGDFGLDNIAVNEVAAVPEPASLLLLGSGLAGVVMKTRRRRKQRA